MLKVEKFPWHEIPDDGGWKYGANLDYMKELSEYWVRDFDWNKHEAKINKYSNFKTNVENIDIHFIHEKGSGTKPNTIITYAWVAWISC